MDAADDAIDALLASDPGARIDLLHELVRHPGHRRHQAVVRQLQLLRRAASVHHLRAALVEGFEVYRYTCSEDRVIAKWFSWALYDIGTAEALAVLREFSASSNAAVSAEMSYRLAKRSQE